MPKTVSAAYTTKATAAANKPLFLLELELDSGTLYLCDAQTNTTFPSSGGNLYLSWGFTFDSVQNSVTGEIDRVRFSFNNVDLTFQALLDADDFQGRRLTLRRIFSDQLDSADDNAVIFKGIMNAPAVNERTVDLDVRSPLSKLSGTIPRRRYQNNCHWTFDGTECLGGGASLADEQTEQTVDAGSTASAIIDAARTEADDYWNHGTVEMTSGDLDGEIRPIKDFDNASATITLLYPFSADPDTGDKYTIRRGCNKTSYWCHIKHANWANFGGFVGMPQRKV